MRTSTQAGSTTADGGTHRLSPNRAWRYTGVDPAPEMLKQAERTLGPLLDRVQMIEGLIDDAPPRPFDAATCLLTLHFLEPDERLRTVAAIHRQLVPGAPFVAAHGSFPQSPIARRTWLDQYATYASASGAQQAQVDQARAAVDASLTMLDLEQDSAILKDGGFKDVTLYFAAFTWRGWIGLTQ